jgi:hypothetical protein
MERREGERFKAGEKYRAKLILAEHVRIKDISVSGVCIETSQRLNTNNIYRIEILSSRSERITPTGVVVRSFLKETRKEGSDTLPIYDVGIKFVELSDDEKNFLEKFVNAVSKNTEIP